MILENKLNITNQVELSKAEERISKQKAKQLFETGGIDKIEVGTFTGLCKGLMSAIIMKATANSKRKICKMSQIDE